MATLEVSCPHCRAKLRIRIAIPLNGGDAYGRAESAREQVAEFVAVHEECEDGPRVVFRRAEPTE